MPISSEKSADKSNAALPEAAEKAAVVRGMFDRIAPRYDTLNRLITLSMDQRWRRIALQGANVGSGDRVIDLGCGTGDLSALASEMGAQVVGVDFSREMLAFARQRQIAADWIQSDVSLLPFPSAWATVAVSGFALRNFVSIPVVLAESSRVLKGGGRLVLIEVDTPSSGLIRSGHAFYFNRIVPLLGALLSDAEAYAYLPRSVSYLPGSRELQDMIEAAEFGQVRKLRLFGGVAQIVWAVRT